MDPTNPQDGPSRQALHAALLDFSSSPGKYQIAFRQPRLLFESLREVLQIASGREGEERMRRAACFFTRTALLYPGADHYGVMGLDPKSDAAELKDRYRLMMRLLHPDFAASDGNWPPDAAVRLNRAYEVLSSPVKRREYDEHLAPVHGVARAVKTDAAQNAPSTRPAPQQPPRGIPKMLIAGGALVCAILAVAALFSGGTDSVQLVQRSQNTEPAAPAIVAPAVVAEKAMKSTPKRVEAALASRPVSESMPSQAGSAPERQPVAQQISALPEPRAALPQRDSRRGPVVASVLRPPESLKAEPARTQPAPSASAVARALPGTPFAAALPVAEASAPVAAAVFTPPAPAPTPPVQVAALPAPTPAPLPPVAAVRAETPFVPAAPVTSPPVQLATLTPAPRAPLKPGLTLVQAQPLLSQLLQLMESGRGERILNLLDVEARSKPSAQALSRQYDSMVEGVRPVKLSHVEFRAEPFEGRLLVVGSLRLQSGEQAIGALGKKMLLRAEFASRDGVVVITGLSGGPAN